MAEVELFNGWKLVSDFDVVTFRPDPDSTLPAPLSEATEAYRVGSFVLGRLLGTNVGFGDLDSGTERYVVINCETSTLYRVVRKNGLGPFPLDEYELIPDPKFTDLRYRGGEVNIDLRYKTITVTR